MLKRYINEYMKCVDLGQRDILVALSVNMEQSKHSCVALYLDPILRADTELIEQIGDLCPLSQPKTFTFSYTYREQICLCLLLKIYSNIPHNFNYYL